MNKDIFCAKEQKVTIHKGEVDQNGEFLFTCQSIIGKDTDGKNIRCDRFVKFPADTDPKQFVELLKAHEEQNTGQVSLEEQEKKLKELINAQ